MVKMNTNTMKRENETVFMIESMRIKEEQEEKLERSKMKKFEFNKKFKG